MQPEAVQMWAALAERDLQKARRLAEDPPYPEGVCFYAQAEEPTETHE